MTTLYPLYPHMDSSRLSLCRAVSIELLPILRKVSLGTPSSKLQSVLHYELSKVCTLLDTVALQLSEAPWPLESETIPLHNLRELLSENNETNQDENKAFGGSKIADRTLVSKGTTALLELSGVVGHSLCSSLAHGHQQACCLVLSSWLKVLRAVRRKEIDPAFTSSQGGIKSEAHMLQPLQDAWSALGLAACNGSEGTLPGAINLDQFVVLMCVLLSPLRKTSGGGTLVDWLLLSPEFFLTATSLLHASILSAPDTTIDPVSSLSSRSLSVPPRITGETEKRPSLRLNDTLLLSRLGFLTQSVWDDWLLERNPRELGHSISSVLCTHLSVAASTVFLPSQPPLVGLWETVCLEAAHSGVSSSPLAQGSTSAASLAVRVLAAALSVIGGGAVITCSRDTEIGVGTELLAATRKGGKSAVTMTSNPFDRETTHSVSSNFLQYISAGVGAACMAAVTPELARSLYSPSLPGNPGLVMSNTLPKAPFTSPASKPPHFQSSFPLLPFQSPLPPTVLEGSLSSTPSPALIVQAVAMASGLASTTALGAVTLYFERLPGALTDAFNQLADGNGGLKSPELPPLPPSISSRVSKCVTAAQTVLEGRRKATLCDLKTGGFKLQGSAGLDAPLNLPRQSTSTSLSPLPSIGSVLSILPSPTTAGSLSGKSFILKPPTTIPTLAISLEGSDDEEGEEGGASEGDMEDNPGTLHPNFHVRSSQPQIFLSPLSSFSSAPFSPLAHPVSLTPTIRTVVPIAQQSVSSILPLIVGEENDSDGEREFIALPASVTPNIASNAGTPSVNRSAVPLLSPPSQSVPTSVNSLSALRREMDATIDALLTTPQDDPSRVHLLGNLKGLREAIRAAEISSGMGGHPSLPSQESGLISKSSRPPLPQIISGHLEQPLSLSSLYPPVSPPLAPSFSLLTATRLSVNAYFGSDTSPEPSIVSTGQLSPKGNDSSTYGPGVSVAPPLPPSRAPRLSQSSAAPRSGNLTLNAIQGPPRASSAARGFAFSRSMTSRTAARYLGPPPTNANRRVGVRSASIGPSTNSLPYSKRLAELAAPRSSLLTNEVARKTQRLPIAPLRYSNTQRRPPEGPPPALPHGKTRTSFIHPPSPLPQRVSLSLDLDAGESPIPLRRHVTIQPLSPHDGDSPLPSQLNSVTKCMVISPPQQAFMGKSFKGLPGRTPLRALFAPALESAIGIKPLPKKW